MREKCCTLSRASNAAARPWLEEPLLLLSLTTANTGLKEGTEKETETPSRPSLPEPQSRCPRTMPSSIFFKPNFLT